MRRHHEYVIVFFAWRYHMHNIRVAGYQTNKPTDLLRQSVWNCVKERNHAKASISTSKTLFEMAFFLDKKQKKNLYKTKDRAVKNRGKKARGSMWIILPKMLKWLLKEAIVNHFISSKRSQLASLHYLEKLSRINRKNFNRERKKKKQQKVTLFKD